MSLDTFKNSNQNQDEQSLSDSQSHDFVSRHLHPVELVSNRKQSESDRHLRVMVRELAQEGEYDQAIILLTQLIERHPQSANDYNNRGLLHFKNAQYAEALADYNCALELNPRLDSAYNNRANYYACQGDLATAIADYDTALNFNPANLRASINQAIAFRQLGLYDLALENLDLALILGRRLKGRIYLERGRTYHLRGDWNCALADYNRAREYWSDLSYSHQQQIQIWLNQLLKPATA